LEKNIRNDPAYREGVDRFWLALASGFPYWDKNRGTSRLSPGLSDASPPDYAALSNNCTTICEDVLRDLGLDFGDVFPDSYWADVYRNFSPAAQENPFKSFFVPTKTGVDYGNPRNYGMDFTHLLFQVFMNQQSQQKVKACVTTYASDNKPVTTCED
jgi:hypothetical protein